MSNDALDTTIRVELTADEAMALVTSAVARMARGGSSKDIVLRSATARLLSTIVAWGAGHADEFEQLVRRMETQALLGGEDGLTIPDIEDAG